MTVTFAYDARSVPPLDEVQLHGSFDPETGRYDPLWNGGRGLPMYDDGTHGDEVAGDRVYTRQVSLVAGQPQEFRWGATAGGQWIVMEEEPLAFRLEDPGAEHQAYAPVTNHLYGVHRVGEGGIRFQTWSPAVGEGDLAGYRLYVDVYDSEGNLERSLPMTRGPRRSDWTLFLENGWRDLEGKTYRYSVRNAQGHILRDRNGAPVTYSDPYARYLQGPQRGLERIFVDPVLGFETGWYDDSRTGGPNYADNPQWARFFVDSHGDADRVELVLRDESGRQLSRQELLQRLGEPRFVPYEEASPQDRRDVDILRRWQVDGAPTLRDYLWTDRVREDGTIEMRRVTHPYSGTSWLVVVNNFPELVGLRYEFRIWKGGRLLGDDNGDGVLDPGERRRTPFNDPYSDVITPRPGSARRSLIRESSFTPRYLHAPRKETDPRRFVIYEAHVGSFMSSKDNAVAATFEDAMANLDYLERLGVNTIELMPTQEFAGKRDWGYTPDFYFAGADAYGFEMDRQEAVERGLLRPDEQPDRQRVWIPGTDALKLFIDEAHRRGFNVLSDVVYNHVSGKADADNPLARIDGDRMSFFRWEGGYLSSTPWGPKPNYAEPGVREFFTNHAVAQLTELGFDGMRFDFTQVFHDHGTLAERRAGMEALRRLNRTLHFVRPEVYTVAEDFSNDWLVAAGYHHQERRGDMVKRGMGFDAVWNDRFRDTVYAAAGGNGSMDDLMDALLHHHGVSGWDRAVIYAHNHDEVGNSGDWIARAAAGSKRDEDVFRPYPRAVARLVAALVLTGPGVPMLWQGEEYLANNDFKHGLTSTWGSDTRWRGIDLTPDRLDALRETEAYRKLSPQERALLERDVQRNGHFRLYRDLVALRASSPAFTATAPIRRLYTHNQDRVLAYVRSGGGDEFAVVANFADRDRPGYPLPLPPGRWREVFNTNAQVYGGSGTGNGGRVFQPGDTLYLPAGSAIVLQRL